MMLQQGGAVSAQAAVDVRPLPQRHRHSLAPAHSMPCMSHPQRNMHNRGLDIEPPVHQTARAVSAKSNGKGSSDKELEKHAYLEHEGEEGELQAFERRVA